MAHLDWNSTYESGIASINYNHRRLISALNDIDDMIENGAGSRAIGDGLGDLYNLATAHFALEEKQ